MGSATSSPARLCLLPPGVLARILRLLGPHDAAVLASTCRQLATLFDRRWEEAVGPAAEAAGLPAGVLALLAARHRSSPFRRTRLLARMMAAPSPGAFRWLPPAVLELRAVGQAPVRLPLHLPADDDTFLGPSHLDELLRVRLEAAALHQRRPAAGAPLVEAAVLEADDGRDGWCALLDADPPRLVVTAVAAADDPPVVHLLDAADPARPRAVAALSLPEFAGYAVSSAVWWSEDGALFLGAAGVRQGSGRFARYVVWCGGSAAAPQYGPVDLVPSPDADAATEVRLEAAGGLVLVKVERASELVAAFVAGSTWPSRRPALVAEGPSALSAAMLDRARGPHVLSLHAGGEVRCSEAGSGAVLWRRLGGPTAPRLFLPLRARGAFADAVALDPLEGRAVAFGEGGSVASAPLPLGPADLEAWAAAGASGDGRVLVVLGLDRRVHVLDVEGTPLALSHRGSLVWPAAQGAAAAASRLAPAAARLWAMPDAGQLWVGQGREVVSVFCAPGAFGRSGRRKILGA